VGLALQHKQLLVMSREEEAAIEFSSASHELADYTVAAAGRT
jgi:hypothetical protein